ncbi:MAG: Rpn family recombination-promoting nuclease/putative transposase [Lachnospiraceae bacterium]|nr:Rpn family recombination-promoting nuclease/putative transposase [Lachnospiraceae bacterium]
MGRIDVATKRFVNISDVFAQLFNVGLFQGDIVVREDGLTDMNSLEDIRLERHTDRQVFERIRDVKKISDVGFALVVLGIEDQETVHYYMPVRAMMYDAASYETQYKQMIEECEQKGISIPYGTGVPKGTQVMPVITLVFYTGKKPWDGPRDLFDLLKIPEENKHILQKYTNNYHIHVIDARHMSDEEINQYTGDLKAFFIMLRDYYDEEMLRGIVARHRETWYAISDIKGDVRYREYIKTVDERTLTGGVDMCETLDYIEERGDAKRLVQSVEAIMRNFNIDLETACKGNDTTVEEYQKAKRFVENFENK